MKTRWLTAGLFLTTLSTLLLELLDSRLLSVLAWYHVSFLAVSLAMLGMSAGAVLVFLGERHLLRWGTSRALVALSTALAASIPVTHAILVTSRLPDLETFSFQELAPLAVAVVLLSLPFLLSGFVVTIALTRMGGRVGFLYGADLLGAAGGCLLVVPLLERLDILSAALVAAAAAAGGAGAFERGRGVGPRGWRGASLALLLLIAAGAHSLAGAPIDVRYARGAPLPRDRVALSRWNAHSHVTVTHPLEGAPFLWGKGALAEDVSVNRALMFIDGVAATPLTGWDGRREAIDWVQHDITALPYHLRSGDVGIIGVGGGRDILSALWAGARSIVALEVNGIFVDLLTGSYRDFTHLTDQPELELVHAEARSYLLGTQRRFDVLQMSLVDTWAATGAGAFTLTENALYTVEAWKLFLRRVRPDGLFSTSRWFSPHAVSETGRLLSLCTAALIESGVDDPKDHVALLSQGNVATLLVSPTPLREADLRVLHELSRREGFRILVGPGVASASPRLDHIVRSRSMEALRRAVADPHFDYSPPTDDRPYFFNMLKPSASTLFPQLAQQGRRSRSGVVQGNLRATATLYVLLMLCMVLVLAIVLLPLAWSGLPDMSGTSFLLSLGYFATIGYGFMSVQIPLLQRFSVFLGHPIYTYSVILFTMILFAGLGSLLSERVTAQSRTWCHRLGAGIVALLLLLLAILAPMLAAAGHFSFPVRCGITVAAIAPLSLLLGFCFPLGMRLVQRIAPDAAPWMWGVNGAAGVLASIAAVFVSMWVDIRANLALAAGLYALLPWIALGLQRRAAPDR